MSDSYYPDLQMADLNVEINWRTQLVAFDNGYLQRNGIWNHPRLMFSLSYPVLYPTQYDELMNFYNRHRGSAESFLFEDYTDTSPRSRQFGVGTGTRREFKLVHDVVENVVIYVDGVVTNDVYVNPGTGRVMFDTAPEIGMLLTYDADNAAYRVIFGDDKLPYERHKYIAYGGDVSLVQAVTVDDMYPIRQEIFGGGFHEETIDATGEMFAFSFNCPTAIDVTEIWFHSSANTNPGTLRVGIYTNEAGVPDTLICSGNIVVAATGWVHVDVPSTGLTRGTRYWIVLEAYSGTWDGTHFVVVNAATYIPYIDLDSPPDSMWYGGYVSDDMNASNTTNSWLSVIRRNPAGVWSSWVGGLGFSNTSSCGAFFLNSAGTIIGQAQKELAQNVYGAIRTRQVCVITTDHDFYIDRVAAVFASLSGAPADSLYYRIEFLSDPGVTQRSGSLASPVAINTPTWIERHLTSPLLVATGDTVYIDFYSSSALVGVPWKHYGANFEFSDYATGWQAGWDAVKWCGTDAARAEISTDGGATWGTSIESCWTVKCRGRYEG
jgi:uncharacterized protein (TIGR02217 family)